MRLFSLLCLSVAFGQQCPDLYRLKRHKYVKVRHEWDGGFQLLVQLRTKIDLDGWTAFFYFREPLGSDVRFDVWEANVHPASDPDTMADGRMVALTSLESNKVIKAGEVLRFIMVVSGGSGIGGNLPRYRMDYAAGTHTEIDLSCFTMGNFTTPLVSTTAVTTTPTGPTTTTKPQENKEYCKGPPIKKDGLYRHPVCKKYYQCFNKGSTVIKSCGPGTVFNWKNKNCDWPANVNCDAPWRKKKPNKNRN